MSQVTETYDCLQVLAREGFVVPEAMFDKLSADKKKWEVDFNVVDVVELEVGDLEMTPPPPSRSWDVPTELPASVN